MTRRRVTGIPNRKGQVELGPMRDAQGLGDTLTVTACAAAIPKAVMLMPEKMKPLAPLFDGLCPVQFTEDYPEFPFCGDKCVSDSNLAICGKRTTGSLPIVKLTPKEIKQAEKKLENYPHPVALVPTCSRQWTAVRGKPSSHFAPMVEMLSRRRTVLQFGWEDYPLIPGAHRMYFEGFRELAALYQAIGLYVGLNTGDYHLMVAVGGKVVVSEPPRNAMGYNTRMWRYASDRCAYDDPSTPESLARLADRFFE